MADRNYELEKNQKLLVDVFLNMGGSMLNRIRIILNLALCAVLVLSFAGCAGNQKKVNEADDVVRDDVVKDNIADANTDKTQASPPQSALAYSNKENAVSLLSEDGKYRVTLYSTVFPLQTSQIHNWIVHVETPSGELVENAKIRVHGGMPAHKHGFPTTPRVKEYLGGGDYKIEGVKFSMPGEWQMRLNIKEDKLVRRDRVVFIVKL